MIKQLLVAAMMFGITSANAEVIKVKFQLPDGTTIQKQYPLKFKQDAFTTVPGFVCLVSPLASDSAGATVNCIPTENTKTTYLGSVDTYCESKSVATQDRAITQALQFVSISRGSFFGKDVNSKPVGVTVRVGCVDETMTLQARPLFRPV